MSLFWKIFLWFLLAISAIVAVSVFVDWTTQREPFAERWKSFMGSQLTVYTETAKQIYDYEGKAEFSVFFKSLKDS